MPFLSSITLNPLRSGAQRLIQDPQALHAAVEGCLPPQRSGRLLWRLEQRDHAAELLVLSPDMPSFDHVVEQAGWPDNPHGSPRTADMSPLLAQVGRGREFSFRTRVNPTESKGKGGGRGVRRGHRTASHQLGWFLARTTGEHLPWGFALAVEGTRDQAGGHQQPVASVSLVERGNLRFRKAREGAGITISTATFEGRLRVTDADLFRQTLLTGIGPGKAYGCGLITLAAGHVVAR